MEVLGRDIFSKSSGITWLNYGYIGYKTDAKYANGQELIKTNDLIIGHYIKNSITISLPTQIGDSQHFNYNKTRIAPTHTDRNTNRIYDVNINSGGVKVYENGKEIHDTTVVSNLVIYSYSKAYSGYIVRPLTKTDGDLTGFYFKQNDKYRNLNKIYEIPTAGYYYDSLWKEVFYIEKGDLYMIDLSGYIDKGLYPTVEKIDK